MSWYTCHGIYISWYMYYGIHIMVYISWYICHGIYHGIYVMVNMSWYTYHGIKISWHIPRRRAVTPRPRRDLRGLRGAPRARPFTPKFSAPVDDQQPGNRGIRLTLLLVTVPASYDTRGALRGHGPSDPLGQVQTGASPGSQGPAASGRPAIPPGLGQPLRSRRGRHGGVTASFPL
jgi:hypothetical protein